MFYVSNMKNVIKKFEHLTQLKVVVLKLFH